MEQAAPGNSAVFSVLKFFLSTLLAEWNKPGIRLLNLFGLRGIDHVNKGKVARRVPLRVFAEAFR